MHSAEKRYLAGFVIISYGISAIFAATKTMKESKGMGILGIIAGILSALVGGFSIMHPFVTMISLGYIIAFNVIMQGINMVVMAFAVDKAKNAVKEALQQ